MTKEMIKPFVWGIVVGAIVLAIVIFSAGWVVTKGKAEQMAKQAVVDKLASICVAQFLQDANKEERLKELKATDSWQRDSYVEKEVGRQCPAKIRLIAWLPTNVPSGFQSSVNKGPFTPYFCGPILIGPLLSKDKLNCRKTKKGEASTATQSETFIKENTTWSSFQRSSFSFSSLWPPR